MEINRDFEPLYVGRPNIGDRQRFAELVEQMFERRWFTNNGQIVQQFETELAGFLGVQHCIAVCNATIGLEMAYRVMGFCGEVIVPAYTFIATAHAVDWIGATPVFVEPDPRTHNLDPRRIEEAISERTSGIVGVHLWGQPCPTDAIESIARRHSLPVVYDAAHAFGTRHQGRMIGNFGDCEVFSFHATKFFNTFEGGAITTNDDSIARRLRLARNFGFDGPDSVIAAGTNGKMTEVCAAMGLANLPAVESFVAHNRRNHEIYKDELSDLPGVRLLDYGDLQRANWQYVVIEIDSGAAGVDRDVVYQRLRAQNVIAKRYFFPGCHRMEPYRTRYPDRVNRYPLADDLCSKVLCLPNGTAVDEADIRRVIDIIRESISSATGHPRSA